VADVDLEQPLEEPRVAPEDVEDMVAEARGAAHQEQGAGGESGETLDAAVGVLVGGGVIIPERGGQGCSLTKAESHAFAGDGIDRSGGVADEGNVAGSDPVKTDAVADGTTRGTGRRGGREVAGKLGEVREGVRGTGKFPIGDKGDADHGGRDGGDVGLTVVAPVNLDEVCPWCDGVVLPQTDAGGVPGGSREVGPVGDARLVAVCADKVARAEGLPIRTDLRDAVALGEALNDRLPMKTDAKGGGAIEQQLMEGRAANTATWTGGEGGFGDGVVAGGAGERG